LPGEKEVEQPGTRLGRKKKKNGGDNWRMEFKDKKA